MLQFRSLSNLSSSSKESFQYSEHMHFPVYTRWCKLFMYNFNLYNTVHSTHCIEYCSAAFVLTRVSCQLSHHHEFHMSQNFLKSCDLMLLNISSVQRLSDTYFMGLSSSDGSSSWAKKLNQYILNGTFSFVTDPPRANSTNF